MKIYLEKFLLPIFVGLVTAVLAAMVTAKIGVTAGVVAIGSIAALAFLAAFLASDRVHPREPQTTLQRARRLGNVLFPIGILIVLAAYVLLRPSIFRDIFQAGPGPPAISSPGGSKPVSSAANDAAQLPDAPRTRAKEVTGRSLDDAAVSPEDAFMKKYLADDGQPYRVGAWTVVISAGGHDSFPELHAAAESALSKKGYAVRPLFRAALLQDSAAYDELYSGNPALLTRIGSYRDGVLIGKLRSELSQNTSLDMFTAHLFADLHVISTRPAKMEGQFAVDETGAGFSEAAATSAAEHRLADKLKQQLLQSIPSK